MTERKLIDTDMFFYCPTFIMRKQNESSPCMIQLYKCMQLENVPIGIILATAKSRKKLISTLKLKFLARKKLPRFVQRPIDPAGLDFLELSGDLGI